MMRKHIDPRVTFLFLFLLTTAAVVIREPIPMLPVFVSAIVAVIIARAPVGKFLRRLRGLWAVIFAVTLLQALFAGDIMAGISIGGTVLQRLVILLLSGTLLLRYPGHVLVQAMLQLRLPYQLAYMLSIGLAFVPRFSESYRDSITAMQLRGVDFRQLKLRARLKIYTWLIMPTIASGVHAARRLSMAMELRGFGAHDKRSSYAPLKMRKKDWLAFAAVLLWAGALAAGIVAWYWWCRWF